MVMTPAHIYLQIYGKLNENTNFDLASKRKQ